jgi:hypothetical protein
MGTVLYVKNRAVAVGAARREEIVIIRLAIRGAVALEKVASAQFLVAVFAGKVLRVPCLAQSGDDLKDGNFKFKTLEIR